MPVNLNKLGGQAYFKESNLYLNVCLAITIF
jgi:hypothetical protein